MCGCAWLGWRVVVEVALFSVCVVVSDVCVVPVLVRACVLSEVEICVVLYM